MTQTQRSTNAGFMPKSKKESPLGLLIAVIRVDPEASKESHLAQFRTLLLQEDYYEFLEALILEWFSIKFSTAMRAAQPPTAEALRKRAAARKADRKRESDLITKAKGLIGTRLLDFIMPNSKKLRDCTGAECKQFGGLFARIGKRVGNKRVVGDVLSAEQLARLSNKFPSM